MKSRSILEFQTDIQIERLKDANLYSQYFDFLIKNEATGLCMHSVNAARGPVYQQETCDPSNANQGFRRLLKVYCHPVALNTRNTPVTGCILITNSSPTQNRRSVSLCRALVTSSHEFTQKG